MFPAEYHHNKNHGLCQTLKFAYSLDILLTKKPNPLKIYRILTVLGTKSNFWTLLVDLIDVRSQSKTKGKRGSEIMYLAMPSRKTDDF